MKIKTSLLFLLSLILISITTHCYAQAIALGNDENTVYNILYDRVNSYNQSQGEHNLQSFDVIHNNGVTVEIIVSMKDGYFYDLGLNSDYAIHYVMKNGILDHIITQYINISAEQIRNRFSQLYGEKHIDKYFFSDDYKSFKTVILDNNGVTAVKEETTFNTKFPPKMNVILYQMGVSNKYIATPVKKNEEPNSFSHIDEKNPYNNVRIQNLTLLQVKQECMNLSPLLNDLKEHFNQLIISRKGDDNSLRTVVEYSCLGTQKRGSKLVPKFYSADITNFKEDQDEFYLYPNSDTVNRHPYSYYLCPFGFDGNGKEIRVFKNKEQTNYKILYLK